LSNAKALGSGASQKVVAKKKEIATCSGRVSNCPSRTQSASYEATNVSQRYQWWYQQYRSDLIGARNETGYEHYPGID
jgi:hypothetical protein